MLIIFPAAYVVTSYLEDLAEAGGIEGSNQIIAAITGLPTAVVSVASTTGYLGVFSLMLLEAAAFPVPSEIILPLSGYLVFKGVLQYWPVVIVSTAASVIGSFADYWVGRALGKSLSTGETKMRYIRAQHLQRGHSWFSKYGPEAVALLRLVPTARVLISFPAGAYRMNPTKFGVYTLLGCLPWNITLVYLGWWLGASWEEVVSAFRYLNLFVYLAMAILVVWVAWRLAARRRSAPGPR